MMDADAARRARQKTIKADLRDALTDEEACPPEWVDLITEIRDRTAYLERYVLAETERFISEPDVRVAIERRERARTAVADRVAEINARVRRLNLIAPLPRFQRNALDRDEMLRPLYLTRRGQRNDGGAMPSAPSTRGPGTPLNS
jgi:hypothetical protein